MLNVQERERVAEAIREAETRTAGEIVVVAAAQASGYRLVPVVLALVVALLIPWPLIGITRLSAHSVFMIQLVSALILAAALSWPGRRHALVPGFVKRRRAHEAALREFVGRGLTLTRGRTGVLIYVAAAENHAEIIADVGVSERLDPGAWREVEGALVEALRQGRPAEGLAAAVDAVAHILAVHAPRRADDVDELPDKVFVT